MLIEMIKQPGGVFIPVDDIESEQLTRFKTGEQYQVEVKLTRNPAFHRKVFAFFRFCFEYWRGNDYQDDVKQRKVFRNHLTCLAGYYDSYHGIDGRVRIEAKSLSFGDMDQEEFEQCYNALIQAALDHVFKKPGDEIYNKLVGFF